MSVAVLLEVAYDGGPFHGFAPQENARTVAGELLGAIREMDPAVRALRGTSRTDAGVHARGQLVAFDTARAIPPRGWVLGLSAHLPSEIAVRRASIVEVGFDARGHVLSKHYRYLVLLDRCRDPFASATSWRLGGAIDLDLARAEAASAVGEHDFAAFRSAADQRERTVRTIHELLVTRSTHDARMVIIDVRGNAFLHNMVRILVGTIMDVARGHLEPGAITRAIASLQREHLGMTAPANGLFLESVQLDFAPPEEATWPSLAPTTTTI